MSKTTLFDSRIRKYAYREPAQIYKDIGASPDGLSPEQVDTMREKYGANSFAGRKNDTMFRRVRRAFINPFNVILFFHDPHQRYHPVHSGVAGKERGPAA